MRSFLWFGSDLIWFVIALTFLSRGFLFTIIVYICSSQKPNEMPKLTLKDTLSTIASLQQKLNMANKTVAELMKEVETLKELAHKRLHELRDKAESLKTLHADYALLEEKYYTQSDNYTEVNKMHNDLIESHNKVTAENHALKAENERTNRHINLAENQLNKEQQPLVVNHYHNCTINK